MGWLASLTLEDDVRQDLSLPLVVCEYEDIFSDELPGLPPHRDVDFIIELHPCMSPISMIVTPRQRESTVHDTVGVYKSTKCHIEIILETKVGNERLWNPEFVVFKPKVQLSFSKKI